MKILVVDGASIMCTMGTAPSNLHVTSQMKCKVQGKLVATINDTNPIVNIQPCGMCTSMANPQVASATAAALGVLTPMPCIPSIAGSFIPTGMKLLIENKPCLLNDSSAMCSYAGTISITYPGQTKVMA